MTQRFYVDQNGEYLGSYDDADGGLPEEFVGATEVPQKPLPPSAPRFFVDEAGKYLGSYDGPDESIPDFLAEGIQVATAPEHAWQVWKDGAWLPLDLPEPISVVYAVDLWSRLTDEEALQVGSAMEGQSFRMQNIFRAANSYRSDHELWSLLFLVASTLFGEDRAKVILAPSETV